ncbi:MAG: TIGR00180 family glycosyltransferase, partial [Pseudomonadota bacterium]
MARILIPTRNRPTSLASVVAYLSAFYPASEVIIADGSIAAFAAENAKNMALASEQLAIDYRQYSYDLPFFDRLLEVLRGESDRWIIMGSDDDYPMMDVLDRAEARLRSNDGAVTAMGSLLNLFVREDGSLLAAIQRSRPLMAADPERRARMLAQWSFATTYAVTDRHHLIERYERARSLFLLGYFDFGVAMHDCLAGKVIALPDLGFVATRNFNHSY